MKTTLTQYQLLAGLMDDVDSLPDAPIRTAYAGGLIFCVWAGRMGLASRLPGDFSLAGEQKHLAGRSAKELARRLADPESLAPSERSLALAALNSLLPPPAEAHATRGQDALTAGFAGKTVVVVGHFPFVERVSGQFKRLIVLERRPRPGDLSADHAAEALAQAECLAVTATTLMNGTLAELLALTPASCRAILLGPSTPFAPSLHGAGLDALAGNRVDDPETALVDLKLGLPYRQMRGSTPLFWEAAGR